MKRYYWLKLKDDFFDSKRIKKLRRLAGGDTFTIIYLKMQLKAMKNGGVLEYSGIENTLAEEIALDIDEDYENVSVTLAYLHNVGLAEMQGDNAFLPYAVENTASETASAQRSRECRKRKVLQCNNNATTLQQNCNVDIDIDKDIDIDIDIDNKPASRAFKPPTVEEVRAYCKERNNNVDAETFIDFYESKGWMIGKTKMKDWKASVRTWEKNRTEKQQKPKNKFGDFHQREYQDMDSIMFSGEKRTFDDTEELFPNG